ncbi:MAG: tetratricopeptide repeat protein, partial [Blastocatellia bacterium]
VLFRGSMNRIFSSIESMFVAIYYAAIFLTPANIRNATRVIADCGLRIADCVRAMRGEGAQTAVILGAVIFAPALGLGQTATATESTTTAVSAALPRDVIALRREGNEALYNMDYATARAKFEEIRKQVPQHPAGDIYVATVIWIEHLNKSRRLQTSLYQSESNFYAGADKAKEDNEGDAVDPGLDRAFRDRMAQAKTKALSLVARNRNDADAQYFLGAYYGVMAGYEASTARKFYSAMRNGSRSVDAHEKTLKLNPNYYDAYLSVGMYDYIAGSLPFMYKALAAIVGVRGNKQRGITRLKGIVEKETATADDARVMLLAIYQNEKRYEDALALLDQLSAKYPRSYLIKLEKAYTLVALKRANDAYAAFEDLLKDPAAAAAVDLAHYQYAEALALNKEYKRAAEHFLEAPKSKGADANLATLALLRAAQVYDLAGQRNDAVAQYKAVLTRPNVYDTREQAEKGLKQPFKEKERGNGD